MLAVYQGADPRNLTRVTCNNDTVVGGVVQSSLTVNAAAGTTYWFQVGGFRRRYPSAGEADLSSGNLSFRFTFAGQ